MRKTQMILAATALTLSLAATAGIADAKPTRHHSVSTAKANAITADLNRKQLQGNGAVTASGAMDASANGNSISNSTGVAGSTDATSSINSAAATTDQNSVPAGSMSSTTNSAVAGDNSATMNSPSTDSTVPNTGQGMDQSTANTQPQPSEDKGAAGKTPNPTDATDQPAK